MADLLRFGLDIFGVFLGVIAAFSLDRFQDSLMELKEYARVLRLIKQELESNLPIMQKFLDRLPSKQRMDSFEIPYYHLRMSIWQGISSKVDSIKNAALLTEIATVYYNYDTFERMLDSFLQLALSTLATSTSVKLRLGMQNRRDALLLEITGDESSYKGGMTLTKNVILSIDRELKQIENEFVYRIGIHSSPREEKFDS